MLAGYPSHNRGLMAARRASAPTWVTAMALTWVSSEAATHALTTARHGYCAPTGYSMGDCLAGHVGSWKLSRAILKEQTTRGAMDECVAGCLRCSRCNYVSMNLQEKECAWTHRCDMSNLLQAPARRGVWRTSLVRNGSHIERIAVGNVHLELHDVVPWSHTVPKPPVPLYVVSGASLQWIMAENRGEALVAFVVRLLSSRHCRAARGRRGPARAEQGGGGLVVDIGSNEGYYALVAAALGCKVVAFEPQPGCRHAIEAAIDRNGFGERMRLVRQPVGPLPSRQVSVPARGCAMMGVAVEGDRKQVARGAEHQVRTTTLEHAAGHDERITLVKVDTEGAEVSVLRGLLPTLSRIDNLVVETSPGWWTEKFHQSRREGAELYASLFSTHGFTAAYTSDAQWIIGAGQMRDRIMRFGPSGYWSQRDIWFGRDEAFMRRAIRAQFNATQRQVAS